MVRLSIDQFFHGAAFPQVAPKGDGSLLCKPPYRFEDLRNWRLVEVVGCFDPFQNEASGAFILRDEAHAPLLARAFPVATGPFIFTEAVALRQAVEAMVQSDELNLIFCTSSLPLLKSFYNEETCGSTEADAVIRESVAWFRRAPGFRLIHVHEDELVAARWLAETDARSQQHIQWDRPLMIEMLREVEG